MGTGWSKLSVEEINVYGEQEPGGKQTLGMIDSLAHFLFCGKSISFVFWVCLCTTPWFWRIWKWRIKWKPWIHSGDADYFGSGLAEVSISADQSTQTSEEATTTKASSSSIPMFQTVDEYGIIAVGGEIEVQFFSCERPTRKNQKKRSIHFVTLWISFCWKNC